MLAVTGARPRARRFGSASRICTIIRCEPKLMMPKSPRVATESQREEDRALLGADHRAAGGQAERRRLSASRPRAAAAARRRQPLGPNPGASYHREVKKIVADTGAMLMRRCMRSAFVDGADAAEKRSDRTRGLRSHASTKMMKSIMRSTSPSAPERRLAPRTICRPKKSPVGENVVTLAGCAASHLAAASYSLKLG